MAGKLDRYQRKRSFDKTPEPSGAAKKAARKASAKKTSYALSYVIQEHDARRLHYDFRLELDGTLKSWAVPKGLSLDPSVKRLAVHVEDHPLDYGSFEGEIPEGNYGVDSVIVWDRGTWAPRRAASKTPNATTKRASSSSRSMAKSCTVAGRSSKAICAAAATRSNGCSSRSAMTMRVPNPNTTCCSRSLAA